MPTRLGEAGVDVDRQLWDLHRARHDSRVTAPWRRGTPAGFRLPREPLESLPADQRAVLQLLLKQGQTYDDLSGLLNIDPAAVRERAHAALDALGPDVGRRLDPARRAEVADYLLGQQPASERAATRDHLAGSAGPWAKRPARCPGLAPDGRWTAAVPAPLAEAEVTERPHEASRPRRARAPHVPA